MYIRSNTTRIFDVISEVAFHKKSQKSVKNIELYPNHIAFYYGGSAGLKSVLICPSTLHLNF